MADEKKSNTGLIIGIIIFVLIVIGVLLYMFVFSDAARKKSLFKKVIEKHKNDTGFQATVDSLVAYYKDKSYADTLKAVQLKYPNDKY